MSSNKKEALFPLLLLGFLDYVGIALVYPLFAYMLFDPGQAFLPADASNGMRGLWLGVLLALLPLAQFFSCPILGALSDQKGRKPILTIGFVLAIIGYGVALVGVWLQSLNLLILYRLLVGIAGGNASVVSAIVADISTMEEKSKHYGLLNMAFGAGFTVGPFLGGYFAQFGLMTPFVMTLGLTVVNWILVHFSLTETLKRVRVTKLNLWRGISQLKQAARWPLLRVVFLALLIFTFGWSFFVEFTPLYLIEHFQFTPREIGIYYGYTGFFYALSAGLLIHPIIKRIGLVGVLASSQILAGLYILCFLGISNVTVLWLFLPLSQFLLAFVYPTTATLISNRVDDERQGEALGIYQAVCAASLALCPLTTGTLIGKAPVMAVIVGGGVMILAGVVFTLFDLFPSYLRQSEEK